MTSDFERRWERIQEQLRVQMNGDVQPRVSSGRTLFGIKSESERKMDEFARQIEAEQAEKRRERKRERGVWFGDRRFWAEGRCVSTVGLNEATIAKCIREQEAADIALDRLSVKECSDPFKK